MLVLHSMNTARKYHGKMKLLPGPDIHTAVQPERDSGSLPQYSIRQHSQHETLLDKKNITESSPKEPWSNYPSEFSFIMVNTHCLYFVDSYNI